MLLVFSLVIFTSYCADKNVKNDKVDSFFNKKSNVFLKNKNRDDSVECVNWGKRVYFELSKQFMLEKMAPISELEWNACYGSWDCNIFFTKDSSYYINAGGWAKDLSGDSIYIYGCKTKLCWQYFLADSMCDNQGNLLD